MTGSWRTLMMVWAWSVVGFGAVLMLGAFPASEAPARVLLTILGGAATEMDAPMRFSIGLMGAVTFGWGLTVLAVASVSHLLPMDVARRLWRRITLALLAWYLIDNLISVTTGFALNIAPNTVLILAFLAIAWRAGVLAAPNPRLQKGASSASKGE